MTEFDWRQGQDVLRDGAAQEWVAADGTGETFVVLHGDPQAVSRLGSMPAEGVISEAPMGEYDLLELSVFARPVARVRWCLDEETSVGTVSWIQRVGESELPDTVVAPVLIERAVDEAWQEGAETLSLLVPEALAAAFVGAGWAEKERVRAA